MTVTTREPCRASGAEVAAGASAPTGASALTGAILAGGDSTRMGRDKAGVLLAGRSLLEHVHGVVAPLCDEVLVVTRDEHRGTQPVPSGCRVVTDALPGRGPLVGIHAALAAAATDRVLVVACDMPWLEPLLLRAMIDEGAGDVVIPRTGRGWEPLHAVYHRRCLAAIEAVLARGAAPVASFFDAVTVDAWDPARCREHDPEGRSCRGVNRPGDRPD